MLQAALLALDWLRGVPLAASALDGNPPSPVRAPRDSPLHVFLVFFSELPVLVAHCLQNLLESLVFLFTLFNLFVEHLYPLFAFHVLAFFEVEVGFEDVVVVHCSLVHHGDLVDRALQLLKLLLESLVSS